MVLFPYVPLLIEILNMSFSNYTKQKMELLVTGKNCIATKTFLDRKIIQNKSFQIYYAI
jgi:hypothetical protein